MVLMGPTSSSVDFSPQGLLEKVFTPLVIHSQMCPGLTSGSTAVCACGGAESGAESGCAVDGATGAIVAAGGVGGEAGDCAAITCGDKAGVALCVETAAKAKAKAAENPGQQIAFLFHTPIILRYARKRG